MLILYTKTYCPFCIKVLDQIHELGLEIEERNISDEKNAKELLEKGGKLQVPFLVDVNANILMYESGDIIEYLNQKAGKNSKEGSLKNSGVCSI